MVCTCVILLRERTAGGLDRRRPRLPAMLLALATSATFVLRVQASFCSSGPRSGALLLCYQVWCSAGRSSRYAPRHKLRVLGARGF